MSHSDRLCFFCTICTLFYERLVTSCAAAARTAELRLDGESYVGASTTLPCYIETFKTYDNRNFYKSADIAQVQQKSPREQWRWCA